VRFAQHDPKSVLALVPGDLVSSATLAATIAIAEGAPACPCRPLCRPGLRPRAALRRRRRPGWRPRAGDRYCPLSGTRALAYGEP